MLDSIFGQDEHGIYPDELDPAEAIAAIEANARRSALSQEPSRVAAPRTEGRTASSSSSESIRASEGRFDWRKRAPSRVGETRRPNMAFGKEGAFDGPDAERLPGQRDGTDTNSVTGLGVERRMLSRKVASQAMLQGRGTKAEQEYRRLGPQGAPLRQHRKADRNALLEAANAYRDTFQPMLAAERADKYKALAERRQKPIAKLVEQGYALDGLQAYWQGAESRHFGNRVAVFKHPYGQRFGWNKFRVGDKVELRPSESSGASGGAKDSPPVPIMATQPIEATILQKSAWKLRLFFEDEAQNADLEGCPSWRMDLGHNDLVEIREDGALAALDYDIDFLERLPSSNGQVMLQGTKISDVLFGAQRPAERSALGAFAQDCRIRSWTDRYVRNDPVRVEGDPELDLNTSQVKAIAMMLRERVSLVQGVSERSQLPSAE